MSESDWSLCTYPLSFCEVSELGLFRPGWEDYLSRFPEIEDTFLFHQHDHLKRFRFFHFWQLLEILVWFRSGMICGWDRKIFSDFSDDVHLYLGESALRSLEFGEQHIKCVVKAFESCLAMDIEMKSGYRIGSIPSLYWNLLLKINERIQLDALNMDSPHHGGERRVQYGSSAWEVNNVLGQYFGS